MTRALGPLLFVSALSVLPGLNELWAALYQCTDALGTTIYTDSPAQLSQCTPVPVRPSSSSPLSSPTPPPLQPPPPTTIDPPLVSEGVPKEAHQHTSDLVPPPPSSVTPCFSGVNPLNPFTSTGCTLDALTADPPPTPASAMP